MPARRAIFVVAAIQARCVNEWVITLFRSDFTTHSASADFMRVDPRRYRVEVVFPRTKCEICIRAATSKRIERIIIPG